MSVAKTNEMASVHDQSAQRVGGGGEESLYRHVPDKTAQMRMELKGYAL